MTYPADEIREIIDLTIDRHVEVALELIDLTGLGPGEFFLLQRLLCWNEPVTVGDVVRWCGSKDALQRLCDSGMLVQEGTFFEVTQAGDKCVDDYRDRLTAAILMAGENAG